MRGNKLSFSEKKCNGFSIPPCLIYYQKFVGKSSSWLLQINSADSEEEVLRVKAY